MQAFLLVAAGGALGAVARYGAGLAASGLGLTAFPWATLFVNVAGGLAMGVLAGSVAEGDLRLLLGVGVLGGFTTFSAFSIETVRMLDANQFAPALGYVAASVLLAVGACWLGLRLAS